MQTNLELKGVNGWSKALLLFFIFWSTITGLFAQNHEQFYSQSLENNKTGMYVLGTWALGNIITGGIGWGQATGKNKYFHQMNLFWNTVNLGIASFGYINTINTDMASLTGEGMLAKHQMFENILLINAGLDIGYMGLGYYMTHAAKTKEKHKNMYKGYGQSIMLQGAFLFVLDLAMYVVQRDLRNDFLGGEMLELSFSPQHLSFIYYF